MMYRNGLRTRTTSTYRRAFIRVLSYATANDGAIPCSVVSEAMQAEGITVDATAEIVDDMYSGGVRLVREDSEVMSTPGEPVYLMLDEAVARVRAGMERLATARRGD